MTLEDLKTLELPLEPTKENLLHVESGLGWLRENTKLEFDPADMESIGALPSGAKLFLCKYTETIGNTGTVVSESVAGMSQSFADPSRNADILFSLARSLIGEKYLKSQFHCIPNTSAWR